MQNHKKIGIVLPTYNEEKNISGILFNIFSSIPDVTVIVVDDSPGENTSIAAGKAISQITATGQSPDYRIVKRVGEKGRASAVREGFRILAGEEFDYIIEMDTDGSHPPSQLPELIKAALCEESDIVICSRDVAGSKIIGWPFQRKLLHFLANFSCRLLLNLDIRDYMNAYRIYSKRAVKVVLNDAGKISTGFWAFGESLVHVKLRGGKIREIPTTFIDRIHGQSQVKLKVIVGCAKELLQVYLLLKQLRAQSFNF